MKPWPPDVAPEARRLSPSAAQNAYFAVMVSLRSSASLPISSATTANPRPCSPALAASIEAFRDSRFIRSKKSSIIPVMLRMSFEFARIFLLISSREPEESLPLLDIALMLPNSSCKSLPKTCNALIVSDNPAMLRAQLDNRFILPLFAPSTLIVFEEISSIEAASSSIVAAFVCVFINRSDITLSVAFMDTVSSSYYCTPAIPSQALLPQPESPAGQTQRPGEPSGRRNTRL